MSKTVVITPSTIELPSGWSVDRFREALQGAADVWNVSGARCGVRVAVGEAKPEWRAAPDGTNLVIFRSRNWCHNGRCGGMSTFPLRSMAMTTPYPADGERPDEADVELNAATFRFTGDEASGIPANPKWAVPIEPVLVHELGHVLGLPDVCGDDRRASGQPVTSTCKAEDRKRVMFAAGLNQRPAPGDLADLCRLYPAEGTEAVAALPGTPRAIAGGGVGFDLLLSLVVIGLALTVGRQVRAALRFLEGARQWSLRDGRNASCAVADRKALTARLDTH